MGSAEGSGNNEKCEYGDFARVGIEVWLRALTKQTRVASVQWLGQRADSRIGRSLFNARRSLADPGQQFNNFRETNIRNSFTPNAGQPLSWASLNSLSLTHTPL